jgi:hypothetical protein
MGGASVVVRGTHWSGGFQFIPEQIQIFQLILIRLILVAMFSKAVLS